MSGIIVAMIFPRTTYRLASIELYYVINGSLLESVAYSVSLGIIIGGRQSRLSRVNEGIHPTKRHGQYRRFVPNCSATDIALGFFLIGIIVHPIHLWAFFHTGEYVCWLCRWLQFDSCCAILRRYSCCCRVHEPWPGNVSEWCNLWGWNWMWVRLRPW